MSDLTELKELTLHKAVYVNDDETVRYTVTAGKKLWEGRQYTFRYGRDCYSGWANHREGAPAVILADGTERWYFYGALHREDGPASYDKKGKPMYRIKGQKVPAMKVTKDKEALWHMMTEEENGKPS